MNEADRWQQVKALFLDALDRPAEARAAFLEAACDGDPALRARLQALLDADEEHQTGVLDAPVLGPPDEAATDPDLDGLVGPYRLVRLLGRGGMGNVYLAERADGAFAQTVALKLIRRGLDTDDILSRFRYERQILASLEHPHIATLHDGGVADPGSGPGQAGRPYFVMEYVDGVPITDYCDARRLSMKQRLALFRTVCRAVQYAHQNLVVHRDLKPSNILVTADGTVKLLDFGIAKLLSDEGVDQTIPQTQRGLRLMTPEYASPEQVRGEAVTTATDVYQLGVLLYELLVGRRPYRLPSRVRHEIERVILEEAPTRPSTAVREAATTEQAEVATISAARGTQPSHLIRLLSGDLDTICLTALQKEPGRRYGSVEQFSEDVRRYLAGLPVTARADTPGYRLGKFVRRHRLGVGATVAVLIALVTGLIVVLWQARVAQREAAKAAQMNAFLQEMLASADPYNQGREVKVIDVLNAAAERAGTELAAQPEIEADVRNTLGVTYTTLGAYEEAERELRRALALREQTLGPVHTDVADTKNNLAELLHAQGKYEAAQPLFRQALALNRTLYGPYHQRVATSLGNLAVSLLDTGDYAAAESLFRQTLAVDEALLGAEHPDVAIDLSNLGVLLVQQERYADAEPLYRRALAIQQAAFGEEHPGVATTLSNLGNLLHDLGKLDEAEAIHRQALGLYRTVYGEAHPQVAYGMSNLGALLIDRTAYAEAAALYRDALALQREAWGNEHRRIGISLVGLGRAQRHMGDAVAAEASFREAVAVLRATVSDQHPHLAHGLYNLGALLLAQGRAAAAEPVLREALAIRRASLAAGHPLTAFTASLLGESLMDQQRYAAAESLLVASYATLRTGSAVDTAGVAQARERLRRFYQTTGRPEEAAHLSGDL